MQLVHDRQRSGIDLCAALDPPEHAERGGEQAIQTSTPHCTALCGILARSPKRRKEASSIAPRKEASEESVQRLFGRVTRKQLAANTWPAAKVAFASCSSRNRSGTRPRSSRTNDDAAAHGNQRRDQRPGIETPGQYVIEQGDVDRRESTVNSRTSGTVSTVKLR